MFGPDALTDALFYRHSPALRFELSGGETRAAQFLQAMDRARAVLGAAFGGAEELVVLRVWDDQTPRAAQKRASLWALARAPLKALGVPLPRPEYRVRSVAGGDGPEHCFALRLPRVYLPELLWGVFARELGLWPKLPARLSVAAPELGLLACPYDDRGLDVIGPNTARLSELYGQFGSWLLGHDRARMAAMFGSAPG